MGVWEGVWLGDGVFELVHVLEGVLGGVCVPLDVATAVRVCVPVELGLEVKEAVGEDVEVVVCGGEGIGHRESGWGSVA